jgi:hypothetical protein
MRSYIFTEKEKALIKRFLEGQIGARDRSLHVIVSRLRHFKDLARDVELYLALGRRLAESEAAVSA